MWQITTRGAYSVVQNRNNPKQLAVRSRCEDDIYNLTGLVPDEAIYNMVVDNRADYRYRIFVTRKQWAYAAGQMAKEINYTNFKDKIKKIDPDRADIYGDVWADLLQIELGRWNDQLEKYDKEPSFDDNDDYDGDLTTTIFEPGFEDDEKDAAPVDARQVM